MLDSIRTLTDIPPDDAVRFTEQELAEARRRRELLDDARQQSRECIEQAQHQAEELRMAAFQQGYAQGVLQAASDLVQTLVEGQSLAQQLHRDLAVAARKLLGTLLRHEALVDEIIGDWLREQQPILCGVLQVFLPERCRDEGESLAHRLRQRWHAEGCLPHQVRIDYHTQERYLLRLADQVLEFDIDAVQVRLSPPLLASLERLPESARALDAHTRCVLVNLLGAFVPGDHEGKKHEYDTHE